MDIFNNREIASAIWLTIIFVALLFGDHIRASIVSIFKILFQKIFIVSFLLMIFYVALIAYGLYCTGLWEYSQLKNTIQWFSFSGIVLAYKFSTSLPNEVSFAKVATDNFTIVMVIEILMNLYPFSLFTELILLPVVAIISIPGVLASFKDEFVPVARFTNKLVALIVASILVHGTYRIVSGWSDFANVTTVRNILLPPILSFLFIPFLYLFVLYIAYDTVFVRLNLGPAKSNKMKRHAKWEIFKICHLNLVKVRGTAGMNIFNLMQIQTKDDIENMKQAYKTHL